MKNQSIYLKFTTALLLLVFAAAPAMAQRLSSTDMDQAKVTKITGQADYKKAGTSDWQKLQPGITLYEGDSLKTSAGSEVVADLTAATKTATITVRESSEFMFKTFHHDVSSKADATLLDVSLGAVLVKAEKLVGTSKFEVKTPTSIVGIRGTTFEVSVAK